MRFLKFAAIFCLLLTACSEQFNSENPQPFNEKINKQKDITTPEQLAEVFLRRKYSEIDRKPSINSKKSNETEYEISIIQQLSDDSIAAEKMVLKAKYENQIWQIQEIRINWKCHEDRGHTNWGTEKCV